MGKSPQKAEKSISDPIAAPSPIEGDERGRLAMSGDDMPDVDLNDLLSGSDADRPLDISVPVNVAGSGSLEALVDTARDYARQATADNTNLAYSTFRQLVPATWC